jgi:hypothetical protein
MTMANTVSESVQNDWQKVKETGNGRLKKIQSILKEAMSETFSELKDGSTEIHHLSRQSLAEMIAQAQADAPSDDERIVVESTANAPEADSVALTTDVASEAEAEPPTWRQILLAFLGLLNSRKGPWTERILTTLKGQMETFDADMQAEYGERYHPFQKVVTWLKTLVEMAHARVSQTPEAEAEAKPVTIEVLDGDQPGDAAVADA